MMKTLLIAAALIWGCYLIHLTIHEPPEVTTISQAQELFPIGYQHNLRGKPLSIYQRYR
jgi:hypothetical protein